MYVENVLLLYVSFVVFGRLNVIICVWYVVYVVVIKCVVFMLMVLRWMDYRLDLMRLLIDIVRFLSDWMILGIFCFNCYWFLLMFGVV